MDSTKKGKIVGDIDDTILVDRFIEIVGDVDSGILIDRIIDSVKLC